MSDTTTIGKIRGCRIPLPTYRVNSERLDGKKIVARLKRMGAKRVTPALRAALIKSGNWGMPKE